MNMCGVCIPVKNSKINPGTVSYKGGNFMEEKLKEGSFIDFGPVSRFLKAVVKPSQIAWRRGVFLGYLGRPLF